MTTTTQVNRAGAKPVDARSSKALPNPKALYYAAIRRDKARGVFPVQCLTLGGFAIHARTAQWDEEAQEANYTPGQLMRLTAEQVAKAEEQCKKLRVQWVKHENGWRAEVVDPTSKLYEFTETRHNPETGQISQEEVELWQYVVIKKHMDEELPPIPPTALQAAGDQARADVANAQGIEEEEERTDPRAFADDKREQTAAKTK